MAKQYKGSLTLDWYNKQKAIVNLEAQNGIQGTTDTPAPAINWINKEEALFYEISREAGKGYRPYWVDRTDIRVKEARPLIFQHAYRAVSKNVEGTLPGTALRWEVEEIAEEQHAVTINNLLIRGDNLLALNALKKRFDKLPETEKVKCIYIDPPYNIGAAFEQYDDNLEHSEWLTLMRDRLILLRDLLSEDGSIWVSIDDKEMAYLKVLMDEVFGRGSFIACNVWQKRYSRENREAIGDVHEYILVYAKNPATFKLLRNLVPPTEDQMEVYKNPNNDPKGRWRTIPLTAQAGHATKSQFYEIKTPSGKIYTPSEGRCWGLSEATYKKLLADGRIYFGKNGDSQPNLIRYLSEVEGYAPWTWWPSDEVGHTDEAKKEMHTLFGRDQAFDTPKPERLMERIFHIATNPGELVLDCFGGSGTTFAVAQKMGREWIGIEVGRHADTHILKRLIATLGGAVKMGIDEKFNWQGGGSFKYYHIGESIINIDPETGKGEFNWPLGRKFIQDSLLLSYDFTLTHAQAILPAQLFEDPDTAPSIGEMEGPNGKVMIGLAQLAEPTGVNLTITTQEIKTIYNLAKQRANFHSLIIYTNKGVDLAQEAIPADLDIIKVPNAIFTDLEK